MSLLDFDKYKKKYIIKRVLSLNKLILLSWMWID